MSAFNGNPAERRHSNMSGIKKRAIWQFTCGNYRDLNEIGDDSNHCEIDDPLQHPMHGTRVTKFLRENPNHYRQNHNFESHRKTNCQGSILIQYAVDCVDNHLVDEVKAIASRSRKVKRWVTSIRRYSPYPTTLRRKYKTPSTPQRSPRAAPAI